MALYETGIASNAAALKTIIETFCTTNGFSLSGGWLDKGNSSVSLQTILPSTVAPTISRSGTTASVVATNHTLTTGDSVTVTGATDSLYNGTFTITVTGVNTFTYVMSGTPAANATGPIVITGHPAMLGIRGATGAIGTGTLTAWYDFIYVPTASWPVTYHLFYGATPDQVVCGVQYDTISMQWIMFGDISKVHASAYVGGNWVWATKGVSPHLPSMFYSISDTLLNSNSLTNSGLSIPFSDVQSVSTTNTSGVIHAEIDGQIFAVPSNTNSITIQGRVKLTNYTIRTLFRTPNTWNSQAILIPIHLEMLMQSSLHGYLGFIEHVRLIRIDNYELGDIITLGSDTWKVYPCMQKDTVYRNGSSGVVTDRSGTLGFAVRYVP